jgi:CubicO group peptidase (beta-lactamase class C family)
MLRGTIDRVLQETDEFIITAMNKYTLPGLAVGVVHDGSLVYGKGFGLADVRAQRPATTDTVFRIASITKTFTAIGLMQLWEQSKFQLDDPVNDYLITYKVQHRDPQAPRVTFRHLLTHTSGIGEFRTMADLLHALREATLGAQEAEQVRTLREYYSGRLTPELYPGEKWAYANHGFYTVGQLIEDISGQPFVPYMREHVFAPLGMDRTDFSRSDRVRDELAVGYLLKKGMLEPVDYVEMAIKPGGAVLSSVNEMAKYVAALMNGGRNEHGSILQPETLRMMMEPHYQQDERLPAMGLGFFLDTFNGHWSASHGGGWTGFTSAMHVAPDDRLAVLVFSNSSIGGGWFPVVTEALATGLLRRLLGVPDPVAQLPGPDILQSPHLLVDLCGSYGPRPGFMTNTRIWMGLGGEIQVVVRDNHLALRPLGGPLWRGITLYPIDPNDPLAFQGTYENLPVSVVFKRNKGGQINRLCAGVPGLLLTLYKRPRMESIRFRRTAAFVALAALAVATLGLKLRRLNWRDGRR